MGAAQGIFSAVWMARLAGIWAGSLPSACAPSGCFQSVDDGDIRLWVGHAVADYIGVLSDQSAQLGVSDCINWVQYLGVWTAIDSRDFGQTFDAWIALGFYC